MSHSPQHQATYLHTDSGELGVNRCPKIQKTVKIEILRPEMFLSKIEIFVKKENFCQKSNFLSKNKISVKNQNFLSTIKIFVNNQNVCHKSKCLSKI